MRARVCAPRERRDGRTDGDLSLIREMARARVRATRSNGSARTDRRHIPLYVGLLFKGNSSSPLTFETGPDQNSRSKSRVRMHDFAGATYVKRALSDRPRSAHHTRAPRVTRRDAYARRGHTHTPCPHLHLRGAYDPSRRPSRRFVLGPPRDHRGRGVPLLVPAEHRLYPRREKRPRATPRSRQRRLRRSREFVETRRRVLGRLRRRTAARRSRRRRRPPRKVRVRRTRAGTRRASRSSPFEASLRARRAPPRRPRAAASRPRTSPAPNPRGRNSSRVSRTFLGLRIVRTFLRLRIVRTFLLLGTCRTSEDRSRRVRTVSRVVPPRRGPPPRVVSRATTRSQSPPPRVYAIEARDPRDAPPTPPRESHPRVRANDRVRSRRDRSHDLGMTIRLRRRHRRRVVRLRARARIRPTRKTSSPPRRRRTPRGSPPSSPPSPPRAHRARPRRGSATPRTRTKEAAVARAPRRDRRNSRRIRASILEDERDETRARVRAPRRARTSATVFARRLASARERRRRAPPPRGPARARARARGGFAASAEPSGGCGRRRPASPDGVVFVSARVEGGARVVDVRALFREGARGGGARGGG